MMLSDVFAGIMLFRYGVGNGGERLLHSFLYSVIRRYAVAYIHYGNVNRLIGISECRHYEVAVEAIGFAYATAHEHAVYSVMKSALRH